MAQLTDELVAEIHAVRQSHAASFDHDLNKIIDDLRAGQDKHTADGWQILKAPEKLPVAAGAVLQRLRLLHR